MPLIRQYVEITHSVPGGGDPLPSDSVWFAESLESTFVCQALFSVHSSEHCSASQIASERRGRSQEELIQQKLCPSHSPLSLCIEALWPQPVTNLSQLPSPTFRHGGIDLPQTYRCHDSETNHHVGRARTCATMLLFLASASTTRFTSRPTRS